MILLQELVGYLNPLLESHLFPDDAPNGLQVEGKRGVEKIGFSVSASVRVIEAAIEQGCDALIVHHGLFWPKDPYMVVGPKKKKLHLLLSSGVSLLAYHLPLDAHQLYGNNWKAARDLGWRELAPFGLMNKKALGVCGVCDPIAPLELQHLLETYYGHSAHVALGGKNKIERVGLVSGGAYKMIQEASSCGLDAFVTGNFDEPAWDLSYELGVHFFALGHYATERVGPRALLEHVEKQCGVVCVWIEAENPF